MALLLILALAVPWLAGGVYTGDDLGAFHLPIRAFFAEQLARGEPFDWMPQLYCGFYLTGEGQAGTYHPVHWLLYRFLPLGTALGAELLLSYPWMFFGTWLWLRRWAGRNDAALLGALVFTFSGFNLLHFVHPNAVAVVAHVPWLLWAIDVALREASPHRVTAALGAVALLTGSQLLLGYPQYVWFSLVAELACAGFLLVAFRDEPRIGCDGCPSCADCVGCEGRVWHWLAIAKGCGLLLGGVQLLPTLDALTQSVRQSPDTALANYGSLQPWNLLQLVAPYFYTGRVLGGNTHELTAYAGAVPLMLAVWFLVRRKALGRPGRLATAAGVFGLAAVMMAVGKYGVLYQVQTVFPLINRFRFPCRYLVLFQLAVAVLAAIGFTALVRDCQRSSAVKGRANPQDHAAHEQRIRRGTESLWVMVGVAAAVAFSGILLQGDPLVAGLPGVLAGPALLAAAALLMSMAARGQRWALPCLVVMAAADLGWYGMSYAVYPGVQTVDEVAALADAPPGGSERDRHSGLSGSGRVLASGFPIDRRGMRRGNEIILCGWRRADGYAGLEPRQQLDWSEVPSLRVAGVSWVHRDRRTASIAGLRAHGGGWLEVPEPLDRVRLVSRVVSGEDAARHLADVDIQSTAVADVPLALPPCRPGSVQVLVDRPGRLRIRCDCYGPQMLVVAESYHPGWQARVDKEPQPVFRLNGDFMGCPVGPGRQEVELRFQPASLQYGRWASFAGTGLLGLSLVCFAGRVGTTRKRSGSREKREREEGGEKG